MHTGLKFNGRRKSIHPEIFFQASTNDLYISSYAPNTKELDLDDLLVYGFGIKLKFIKTAR
jgi:hypothetical protein